MAQTHLSYLPLLQRYAQALRSRNALLKQGSGDLMSLESFTQELAELGRQILRFRMELLPRLSALTRLAYRRISNDQEELKLEYQSTVHGDMLVELAQTRERERVYRSTLIGPHRDDLRLLLNDQPAIQYASEGQKRSVAIALKMAQAEYLTGLHGAPPVLLIDDVMGELDVRRRSGFLPLLQRAHHGRSQVFMTATQENWPQELSAQLVKWEVQGGAVRKMA